MTFRLILLIFEYFQVEEEERSERCKHFLKRQAESTQPPANGICKKGEDMGSFTEGILQEVDIAVENVEEADRSAAVEECVPELLLQKFRRKDTRFKFGCRLDHPLVALKI